MTTVAIPGYRFGDPSLPRSPYTEADLVMLKQVLLFSDEDIAALRRAGEILAPHVEELLDIWYSFVGSLDFLLRYFATAEGPNQEYLARVRKRFGQWVLDTCRAEFDQRWLDYAYEIGRRHFDKKNQTDHVEGAPPFVHYRYMIALVYPIYATVRPFLERGERDTAMVERMHQAWLKAVLLQAILWTYPYVKEGVF
ncbi:MAG: protoglobin domain-containing protein [Thermomicrobium sp.]|nr:protoglobin domain-containing protein [Thermomicrobium sp.]MDW8006216.1 protoglobin domain-containing protein [Thermomicrobium sp.]